MQKASSVYHVYEISCKLCQEFQHHLRILIQQCTSIISPMLCPNFTTNRVLSSLTIVQYPLIDQFFSNLDRWFFQEALTSIRWNKHWKALCLWPGQIASTCYSSEKSELCTNVPKLIAQQLNYTLWMIRRLLQIAQRTKVWERRLLMHLKHCVSNW